LSVNAVTSFRNSKLTVGIFYRIYQDKNLEQTNTEII